MNPIKKGWTVLAGMLCLAAATARANEMTFTFVPLGGAVVDGGQLVDIEVLLTNNGPDIELSGV
jgi:hypothetical protein